MKKTVFYLSAAVVFNVMALLSARAAYLHHNVLFTWVAMLTLGMAGFCFALLLRDQMTAIVNVLWIAFSTMGITVMSFCVFDERMSLTQLLGMLIVLVGLTLLGQGGAKPDE